MWSWLFSDLTAAEVPGCTSEYYQVVNELWNICWSGGGGGTRNIDATSASASSTLVTTEQGRIEHLLQTYPQVSRVSELGSYPIHAACRSCSTGSNPNVVVVKKIIQALLVAWPDAIRATDAEGRLPIHVACEYQASLEVVQVLLQAWPDSIRVRTPQNTTCLQVACFYQAPANVVLRLLEAWPAAAQDSGALGAASRHGSILVMQALLEVFPEGVQLRDWQGRTILHIICQRKIDRESVLSELLETIVVTWPRAVYTKDKDRHLPLDILCSNSKITISNELIHCMVDGKSPLHFVCEHSALHPTTLQQIIQIDPDSVHRFSFEGKLPLHLACCNDSVTLPIVRCLVEMQPETARHRCRSPAGNLPLHYYCASNNSDNEIVAYLAHQYPPNLRIPNASNWLPVHLACLACQNLQVIYSLLRWDPDSLVSVYQRTGRPEFS